MEEENNPLESLVGEEELDRELLLSILDPYLKFDEEGNIVYRSNFRNLSSKEKILLFLLARKALSDLGMKTHEGVAPNKIADKLGINNNTVRSSLSRLKDQGLVKKGNNPFSAWSTDSGSTYEIPNSVLPEVKNQLND